MLFKKNKKQDCEEVMNYEVLALTSLLSLCSGSVHEDMFTIEGYHIYVYANVVSLSDGVAQIVYQLHHDWLDEPITESIAADGDTLEDAIHHAAKSFYENILGVYMEAVQHSPTSQCVRIMTQEPHDYHVYRGQISGLGHREGILEGDFWNLLQEELLPYISNQKAYWIRVFASKNKNNLICEVRINGKEVASLSERLLQYAEEWNCMDAYHTEKQCILLVQDDESYLKGEYGKEEIMEFTKKVIPLFEKCKSKEEHKNIKKQLFEWCKDESLTYEIYSLVPEFYCMHAYSKVEFDAKVLLVRKGKVTKEIHSSQLYSFSHIQKCVEEHLKDPTMTREVIETVLQFSTNAKAIQNAIEDGCQMEELMIPGIGILIPENYIMR